MKFNPYRDWLGLPDAGRPSTFYGLLGIRLFENDAAAIQSAIVRAKSRLNACKTAGGPDWAQHEADWQRICGEIATAKRTLGDPVTKQRYDATLRERMAASPKPLPPASDLMPPGAAAAKSSGAAKKPTAVPQGAVPPQPISPPAKSSDVPTKPALPARRPAAASPRPTAPVAAIKKPTNTAPTAPVENLLPPSFGDGDDAPPDPGLLLGNAAAPQYMPTPAAPVPSAYSAPAQYSAPAGGYGPPAGAFPQPQYAPQMAPAAAGPPGYQAMMQPAADPSDPLGLNAEPEMRRRRRRKSSGGKNSPLVLAFGVIGLTTLVTLGVVAGIMWRNGGSAKQLIADLTGQTTSDSSKNDTSPEVAKSDDSKSTTAAAPKPTSVAPAPVRRPTKLSAGITDQPTNPPASDGAQTKPTAVAVDTEPKIEIAGLTPAKSDAPVPDESNPDTIKPEMTKPAMAKPDGTEPAAEMPKPDAPKPRPKAPSIDPAKSAQLRTMLVQSRELMKGRNLAEAAKLIDDAKALAQTPEQETSVNRYDLLRQYVGGFWDNVGNQMARLKAADVIKVGNTEVIVIESSADSLAIRREGGRVSYSRQNMPAGLALALARGYLDDKKASNKVYLGAYVLVALDDAETAKRYWEEASLGGADTQFLMPLLAGEAKVVDAAKPSDRRGLPAASDLVAAEKAFQEEFGAAVEMAKTAPKKAELGQKLFDAAASVGDDSSKRYVMLREAREYFGQGNQADRMLEAIDEMGKWFTIDAMKIKADLLTRYPGSTQAAAKLVASAALKLMGEAEATKRLDAAESLGKVATLAAKKSAAQDLIKLAKEKNDELQKLRSAGS